MHHLHFSTCLPLVPCRLCVNPNYPGVSLRLGLFLYHAGTFFTACLSPTHAQFIASPYPAGEAEQGGRLHVHPIRLGVFGSNLLNLKKKKLKLKK